jgi:hypothetical protein
MGTNKKSNRATEEQQYNKQITAIPVYITGSIQLEGETYTPQQLVAIPQAALLALQQVDAATLALQQKRQAALEAVDTARTTSASLHAYLIGAHGKTSAILTAFGFTPAAPVVKSVQVKANAVLRGAATRKDRHTMGPKQKAEIKAPPVTIEAQATVAPVGTPPKP